MRWGRREKKETKREERGNLKREREKEEIMEIYRQGKWGRVEEQKGIGEYNTREDGRFFSMNFHNQASKIH